MGLFGPSKTGVLCVDDSEETQALIKLFLSEAGYRVFQAMDGVEALKVAEKEKPDLILLDIYMKGMDGIATCAEFKKNPKLAAIPIVMCTALGLTKDINRAFAAGAADYVTKPIDKKFLLDKIEKHTSNKK